MAPLIRSDDAANPTAANGETEEIGGGNRQEGGDEVPDGAEKVDNN